MYHSPIQLDVFPTVVQLRRIDPARNMRRFYRLSVQSDLFGRASLVREWGRIGFRGQMMVETHPDEGKAVTALMKLAAAKKRAGLRSPAFLRLDLIAVIAMITLLVGGHHGKHHHPESRR